ncbi:polyphosphate:AMP phosphotransferase [Halomonas sp. YLGW01]|uniref:polyphosphate:AMP phosphotransferase n=1 Tax=Halomonas sp. YLGW01 TaxID=2773308 RepID=UPI00177F6B97|nr:polyphosphate:AMP phosphotransferase [Halomonas sp. YLGW01]
MKKDTLRYRLLAAQLEMARREDRALVLLLGGQTASYMQPLLNLLNQWLENRRTEVHALEHSSEEARRPALWRYWRRIPARGTTGIFVHGWYGDALFARAERRIGAGAFEDHLERIRDFEAELAAENVVLVKIWLDIDREAQGERLAAMLEDPARAWQLDPSDWQRHLQHPLIESLGASLRETTQADWAPWFCLTGKEPDELMHQVAERLLEAMSRPSVDPEAPWASSQPLPAVGEAPSVRAPGPEQAPTASPDKADYHRRLVEQQARLSRNSREAARRGIPVVLVFEGHDAAGKGGSIHRVTSALEARRYRVHSIAAPSDEERAHPWAWRFWRRLPADGRFALFDRSWYGRVLVERVEGFATPAQWRRAYGEIRHFEQRLLEHGTVLGKFFLSISKDEQLRRFEARARTPHKQHKLTEEDWRNRARWEDYQGAIDDMFTQTHRPHAPWSLIACDDKRQARLEVIEQINALLERRLDGEL